jgi:maltooligosyltrehalose trehalohydrolase
VKLVVWAPNARTVDIVIDGHRTPMQRDSGETWGADIDATLLGAGYRYSIDSGAPLPDPRSRWQPEGVHGASHVVATVLPRIAAAAPFRAPPLARAIIYELHIGTFTREGTYAGAAQKLPHLVDLGVTHLELMPLATFPGRHGWGYDGVDWYAPHPAYGSPQELADFVARCHACGLAVLLDVVYNHFGPDGNYWGQFGPYYTDRIKTPWGDAINYDGPLSDAVRGFVVDNALMWLRDYGFDGLRLDAVHAIVCLEAVHILEELAIAVDRLAAELGRPLVLIAESDANDPRLVRPRSAGGYQLDAVWADDFHHSIHRFFTGETNGYYADFKGLADIAMALRHGYVFQGQYSVFRRRHHGKAPLGIGPSQLVVCAQNHDQIGNRAGGERLSMLLELPQLQAIAALTVLAPFVPLLFQGEEWGAETPFLYFTDHLDPELASAVAAGRRREFEAFGWQDTVPNPQELETFMRSKLDWSELTAPRHALLYAWYRRLIRIRLEKRTAASEAGSEVAFDAQAGWLTFHHAGVLAVFNFAELPQIVPKPAGPWVEAARSDPAQNPADCCLAAGATRIFTTGS